MANTRSLDLESSSSQYAYITDANQTGLDLSGDFTLECWIKRESVVTSVLLSKWDDADGKRQYRFWISSSNYIYCDFSDDGLGTGISSARTTNAVASNFTGVWNHVAASVDVSGGAGGIQIYVNGEAQAMTVSSNNATNNVYNGSEEFQIGANSGGTFFDGLIDEVRVWNDIRTPNEIEQNFHKELVGNEANLQGYWKLNNDYTDESGNNNTLTPIGSPVFSTDVPFVMRGNAIFFGINF